VGLITLPPSSADCFEISQPHPPGTLRGCSGLYRSCFTLPIWTPTIKTYLFNVATIQRAGQLRMEVRFVANANLFLSGPHINAETNITSYPLRSGSTFLDVERVARQYICLVSWLHPIPPHVFTALSSNTHKDNPATSTLPQFTLCRWLQFSRSAPLPYVTQYHTQNVTHKLGH
jgi:hypothetical protein